MTPETAAQSVLKLRDEAFLNAPDADLSAQQIDLLDSGFEGIILAAPQRARPLTDGKLPLAVGIASDGIRNYDFPPPYNTYLLATDLQNGEVHFRTILRSFKAIESRGGNPLSRRGERPTDEELEGETALVTWVDAAERLFEPIPFTNGPWAFSALYFDQRSNMVCVSIDEPDAPPSPPIDPSLVRAASDGKGLPSFHPNPAAPNAPPDGAAFALADRGAGPDRKIFVTGEIRLPVPPGGRVAPFIIEDRGISVTVTQVMPVSFLLIAPNGGPTWRRETVVPIYVPSPEGSAPAAHFTMELLDAEALEGVRGQSCALYLCAGGHVFGPQMIS